MLMLYVIASSYKKLGAKKILKAEGKRKKQYTGKPVNDDDIAASIQNELSLQKKQDAIVQQHNVSYGDAFGAKSLYVGPESDVYELKKVHHLYTPARAPPASGRSFVFMHSYYFH